MVDQTPVPLYEVDEPALRFDHVAGIYRPVDLDFQELMADPIGDGVGALPPGGPCPRCSYYQEGRCHWCPKDPREADLHPECAECEGRVAPATPWYERSEIVVPVLTTVSVTVIASVLSTIALRRLGVKGAE